MTWPELLLGDIAHLNIGRTPPRKTPAYWTSDLTIPFLSIAEMRRRIADPVNEGVTQLAIEDGKAKIVPAGALLMSFKLTIGKMAFAAREMCTNEAIVWLDIRDGIKVLPAYLACALETIDLTAGQSIAVKGATLNKSSMRQIAVPVPPLEVQRRIVDLIDHIDQVILLATASAETAQEALAPVWEDLVADRDAVQLTDRAHLARIRVAPKDMPLEVTHYSIPVLDEFDGPALEASSTIKSGKFAVHRDAVLLSLLNPRIQRVWTARGGEGVVCSTEFAVLEPKHPDDLQDLYWSVRASAFKSRLESVVVGTTGSRQRVKPQQVIVTAIVEAGTGAAEVAGVLDQCRRESAALRASAKRVRQAVLASIMAGEMDLPDSYDRFLQEVAA